MLVQRLLNAHCKGSGLHNDPVTTLAAQLCGSYNQARTVCLILLIRALRLAWNPKELKHTYTHIYTTQHTQTHTHTHPPTYTDTHTHIHNTTYTDTDIHTCTHTRARVRIEMMFLKALYTFYLGTN